MKMTRLKKTLKTIFLILLFSIVIASLSFLPIYILLIEVSPVSRLVRALLLLALPLPIILYLSIIIVWRVNNFLIRKRFFNTLALDWRSPVLYYCLWVIFIGWLALLSILVGDNIVANILAADIDEWGFWEILIGNVTFYAFLYLLFIARGMCKKFSWSESFIRAAGLEHTKKVMSFIKNGALIHEQKYGYGREALEVAAKKGHTEIVNILKQAGAKK